MPNPPELSGSLVDVVVAVAAFVAAVVVDEVAAACVPVSDRFPVVSCAAAAAAAATVDVENVAEAEAETGAETELEA